jgi:hypothetical protein
LGGAQNESTPVLGLARFDGQTIRGGAYGVFARTVYRPHGAEERFALRRTAAFDDQVGVVMGAQEEALAQRSLGAARGLAAAIAAAYEGGLGVGGTEVFSLLVGLHTIIS